MQLGIYNIVKVVDKTSSMLSFHIWIYPFKSLCSSVHCIFPVTVIIAESLTYENARRCHARSACYVSCRKMSLIDKQSDPAASDKPNLNLNNYAWMR